MYRPTKTGHIFTKDFTGAADTLPCEDRVIEEAEYHVH